VFGGVANECNDDDADEQLGESEPRERRLHRAHENFARIVVRMVPIARSDNAANGVRWGESSSPSWLDLKRSRCAVKA
jgi:hypothetical protein